VPTHGGFGFGGWGGGGGGFWFVGGGCGKSRVGRRSVDLESHIRSLSAGGRKNQGSDRQKGIERPRREKIRKFSSDQHKGFTARRGEAFALP